MAKLVCQSGPCAGQEYVLTKDLSIMGRQSTCEIQVMDNMSSRSHCQIRRDGKLYSLVDLGSRNGTKLNNKKVHEHLLSFGDVIAIGDAQYCFVKEAGDSDLNDLLTKYEVQEKIGAGGMGIVYKAVQRSMARTVALKILSPKYSQKPRFVEQFIREARAAGQLNHPNIIQVHEVGSENDIHFFSMEYVDGPTCAQALKASGCMELDEALEIARQTARALEYAHSRRLIHQDIKPDNIMIGVNNTIKVADLGISKSFDEVEEEAISGRKRLMGTPHYMAPEAAQGHKIDHRIDIYSLGATLYHLIAGRTPFTATDPTEILRAHITEIPDSLDTLDANIPESVCQLVEKMMEKNPNDRFQTASEAAEAMEALLSDGSVPTQRKPGDDAISLRRLSSLSPGHTTPNGSAALEPKGQTTSRHALHAAQQRTKKMLTMSLACIAVLLLILIALLGPANSRTIATDVRPTPPASVPAPVDAKPLDIQEEQRRQLAKELTQLEARVQQSVSNNAELPPFLKEIDTLRRRDGDHVLNKRLDALTELINDNIRGQRIALVGKRFQTLKDDVQVLVKEHDYEHALSLVDGFSDREELSLRNRWAELRNNVVGDQDTFNSSLKNRIQLALSLRHIGKLKDISAQMPAAYKDSDFAKEVARGIATLENDQRIVLQRIVKDAASALVSWDFSKLDTIQRDNAKTLQQTAEKKQIDDFVSTAQVLSEWTRLLARQLEQAGTKRPRFQGVLATHSYPELDGANQEGVQLLINGGIFTVRWSALKADEIAALSTQVFGPDKAKPFIAAAKTRENASSMAASSMSGNP